MQRSVSDGETHASSAKMTTPLTEKISEFTVRRLSSYYRILSDLEERGIMTVSSARLADLGGITSAQVRKDLSYFGNFGTRGLGYVRAGDDGVGRTAVDPRGDFGDVRVAPLPFYDPGKRKPRRGWPVAGTRRR